MKSLRRSSTSAPAHGGSALAAAAAAAAIAVVVAAAAAAAAAAAQQAPQLGAPLYMKAARVIPSQFSQYGAALAVDRAGLRMVVGATGESTCPGDLGSLCVNVGAAFVYDRASSGAPWTLSAVLKASNYGAADDFGVSVGVSGSVVVVGADQEDGCLTGVNPPDSVGCNAAGAAYVFELGATGGPGNWTQVAYLKAPVVSPGDQFGESVAVDGNVIAVGSPKEDSCATGIDGNATDGGCSAAGAAHVFERVGEARWQHSAYLKANFTERDQTFGHTVSVSGSRIAVGAPFAKSSPAGTKQGYVTTFLKSPTWGFEAIVEGAHRDGNEFDYFGTSVSLERERMVVGAPGEGSCATGVNGDQTTNGCSRAGAAFVFDLSGGEWNQTAYLKKGTTDIDDDFGTTVAIAGDRVVVGAVKEDSCANGTDGDQQDNGCADAGAAFLFEFVLGQWQPLHYVKPPISRNGMLFGSAVALSDEHVVVSAPIESGCSSGLGGNLTALGCASDEGAAFAFDFLLFPSTTGTTATTATTASVTTAVSATATTAAAATGSASSAPPPSPPPDSVDSGDDDDDADGDDSSGGEAFPIVPVLVGAGAFCVILIVIIACVILRRRSRNAGSSSNEESGSSDAVEMPKTNTPAGGHYQNSNKPGRREPKYHNAPADNNTYAAMTSEAPSKGDKEDENYASFVASAEARDLTGSVAVATQIGEGNFGRVFRGEHDGRGVAIKQILADAGADAQEEVAKELAIMLKLNSPRIIKLFGVCQLPEVQGGGMGLVMELAAKGSLDDHLKREGDSLGEAALIEISQHIAEGLAALHRASVVHRDLAARNVLVTADGMCKLADFGLSRSLGEEETYAATSALPVRWTAPETLTDGKVTQASDLYSLAMTMLEVFDGARLPFEDVGSNMEIIRFVTSGKRPEQPDRCPDDVFEVMENLWAQEPKERTKAKTAASQLRALKSLGRNEDTYQSVFAAREAIYEDWE